MPRALLASYQGIVAARQSPCITCEATHLADSIAFSFMEL